MGNNSSQIDSSNYKLQSRSESEPSLLMSNVEIKNSSISEEENVDYCFASTSSSKTPRENSTEKEVVSMNSMSNCLTVDNNIALNDLCRFDPRSPNMWYPRTPILVENTLPCNGFLKQSNILYENEVNIDPRSPADSFNRTPVLKLKTTQRVRCNLRKNLVKTNSDIDRCFKLSYCETTSLYKNIPEIQAQPDIAHLENYSIKEKLHSNLIPILDSDDKESNIPPNFTVLELPLKENNSLSNNIQHLKVNKVFEGIGQRGYSEEKFVIWQDQNVHCGDTSNDTQIDLKSSSKVNDILVESNGISASVKKDLLNDEKFENMSDCKSVNIKFKHRTPLSNRSNNRQIEALTSIFDQSFIKQSWNKDMKMKNCQENTPMKMKKALQSPLQ